MPERARPPEDISPDSFFTDWIVGASEGDPERARRLGDTDATIEFTLEGEPAGVYTVRIAAGSVAGCAGPADEADLRVRLDTETWRALNAGTLSAPEALLRRKVHLRGSFLLALKLHLILG